MGTTSDTYAMQLRGEWHGNGANVLTDSAKAEYLHAKSLLSTIASKLTLVDVVQHYMRFQVVTGVSPKVSTAVAHCLKEKKNMSERYHKQIEFVLGDFTEQFGERKPADITGDELKEFIFARRLNKTKLRAKEKREVEIKDTTRHNLFRALQVFFSYCKNNNWISEIPLNKRHIPKVGNIAVTILSIPDTKRVLDATPDDMRVFMALALFCGVRIQELCKLRHCDIAISPRDEMSYVLIGPNVSKTNRARNIQVPYNCELWINDYLKEDESPLIPVKASSIFYRVRAIGIKAGVKLPQNVMRHSFASYYYETTRDAEQTRYRLGHNTPTMLFDHYRALVLRIADAPFNYFKILPEGKSFDSLLHQEKKDVNFLAQPTQPALRLLRLL